MIISILLFIVLLVYIHYLVKNQYIHLENFVDMGNPDTSHTINLSLTRTYDCKNMCGPTATCAITKEQCSTDVDCNGCRPRFGKKNNIMYATKIEGSPDTSPIKGLHMGLHTWRSKFDQTKKIFDARYKPKNALNYPERYTLSGEFVDDGPYAFNS